MQSKNIKSTLPILLSICILAIVLPAKAELSKNQASQIVDLIEKGRLKTDPINKLKHLIKAQYLYEEHTNTNSSLTKFLKLLDGQGKPEMTPESLQASIEGARAEIKTNLAGDETKLCLRNPNYKCIHRYALSVALLNEVPILGFLTLAGIAETQAEFGDIEGAEKTLEFIHRRYNRLETRFEIIKHYADKGMFQKALELTNDLKKLYELEDPTENFLVGEAIEHIAAKAVELLKSGKLPTVLEQAAAHVDDIGYATSRSDANLALAKAYKHLGDENKARALLKKSAKYAIGARMELDRIEFPPKVAVAQYEFGFAADAQQTLSKAIELADLIRSRDHRCVAYAAFSDAFRKMNDPENAEGFVAKIDIPIYRVFASGDEAKWHMKTGREQESRDAFLQAIILAYRIKSPRTQELAFRTIARAQAEAGLAKEALSTMASISPKSDKKERDHQQSRNGIELVRIAYALLKRREVSKAILVANSISDPSDKAYVLTGIAIENKRLGQTREAEQFLAEAYERALEIDFSGRKGLQLMKIVLLRHHPQPIK